MKRQTLQVGSGQLNLYSSKFHNRHDDGVHQHLALTLLSLAKEAVAQLVADQVSHCFKGRQS